MAKREWTPAQSSFIEAKKGPILVSAAAGSGKTAAIVERVTRRLSDRENPLSADRLLMTTFSVAAAGEMQERIEAALEKMLTESPENDFILNQIDKMQNATVCTIHSLCFKIIRENFSHLGLSCDFRVVDEAEDEFIMRSSLERVIKRAYDREEEHLESLIELVCKFKNDRDLSEIILKLYRSVIAMPFPQDVLSKWLSYHTASDESYEKWTELIYQNCRNNIDYALKLASQNLSIAADCERYEIVKTDADCVSLIVSALDEKDFSKAYAAANSLVINNRSVPKVKDKGELAKLKFNRKAIEGAVKSVADQLCYTDREFFNNDQSILYPNIKLLFELVSEFIEEFAKAKREKNLLDFSDAEQFALSLLWKKDQNGAYVTTELAQSVRDRFDEIYIDEYQDVNAAQEMIFKAISPDNGNVFMVGDVKQSIYGFRHADSDIFETKRNTYSEYDGKSFPATVFFDKNFRSRKGVIDFINQVFFKIMKKDSCGSNYTEKEALSLGANYIDNSDSGTEFIFYETEGTAAKLAEDEAKIIAGEIQRLIQSGYMVQDGDGMRPCRPSDFCILARSSKKFPEYLEAISKLNINARITKSKDEFLESREMRIVLSVLRAINNPYDEISLAAAMMSPVFVFTPEQLAAIKCEDKNITLFDSVKAFAEKDNTACVEFIKTLRNLQRLASAQSVDGLVSTLYNQYGIYNMVGAMPCGDERMANLDIFRHYARQFEQNGYKGLSDFMRFIDNVSNSDKKLKGAGATSEGKEAVSIMTIHASKGLEYPICFLANSGAAFNSKDTTSQTFIDKKLGFSCIIKDDKRAVKYAPLSYTAIKINAERKQIAEEMRILYVALTRAREKLIIPVVRNKMGEFLRENYLNSLEQDYAYPIKTSKSYAKWLIMSSAASSFMKKACDAYDSGYEALYDGAEFSVNVLDELSDETETETIKRVASNENIIEKLRKAAAFEYPFKSQTDIPSKFSVSEILKSEKEDVFDFETKPDFMSEKGMSGAERGTALHTFMQFADFAAAASDLQAEIENVFRKGHISEKQKDAIELSRLKGFFESNLFERILNADKVMREYKFMTGIDSKQFGGSSLAGDKVVLQGIADCVIVEGNTATIIDYKTDFVKEEEQLVDRYGMQLAIYKGAIEKLLGLKVKECLIYSFCLGKEIIVETEQNII